MFALQPLPARRQLLFCASSSHAHLHMHNTCKVGVALVGAHSVCMYLVAIFGVCVRAARKNVFAKISNAKLNAFQQTLVTNPQSPLHKHSTYSQTRTQIGP